MKAVVRGGNSAYCVKALPDIYHAGEVGSQVAMFAQLRDLLVARIGTLDSADAIRRSLETLLVYVPTHAAFELLPGHHRKCLVLLRKYCEGESLQALTASIQAPLPLATRFEAARRIIRLVNTLDLNGFVHLDSYPDNVFMKLRGNDVLEVSLIDLEGVGVLGRDVSGRFGRNVDFWMKEPSVYGKPGIWIWSPWYPRQDPPGIPGHLPVVLGQQPDGRPSVSRCLR